MEPLTHDRPSGGIDYGNFISCRIAVVEVTGYRIRINGNGFRFCVSDPAWHGYERVQVGSRSAAVVSPDFDVSGCGCIIYGYRGEGGDQRIGGRGYDPIRNM